MHLKLHRLFSGSKIAPFRNGASYKNRFGNYKKQNGVIRVTKRKAVKTIRLIIVKKVKIGFKKDIIHE